MPVKAIRAIFPLNGVLLEEREDASRAMKTRVPGQVRNHRYAARMKGSPSFRAK